MNKRNKNGITLIALIITIIVLLILAGITISLVVGDNGVLSNAKKSSQETIVGREKETIAVSWGALVSNKLVNDEEITDESFEQELDNNNNDVTVSYDDDGNYLVHFNDTGHNYVINRVTGEVVENGTGPSEAEAPDIYVTLYADGTLGFCSTEDKIAGKTVIKEYGTIKNQSYLATNPTPWYDDRNNIQTINFSDEILPTSTRWWFDGCTNLQNIVNIGNLNTSNVTTMAGMFQNCEKLEHIDVTGFNTSKCTSMGWMFFNCHKLQSIDVSHFDTRKVVNMEGFLGSTNPASITESIMEITEIRGLENFNTSKVTSMAHMFDGCVYMERLAVGNWDTSNVVNMQGMFSRCVSWKNIDVNRFDTRNCTNMGWMFDTCHEIRTLDLYNFDTSKVTNMTFMFNSCKNMTSLNIDSFDTSNVIDMSYMFNWCDAIEKINISVFDTRNVTNMKWMFDHCSNLTTVFVGDGWNTGNVTESTEMFLNTVHIVGGAGTTFNYDKVDKAYARVDGGTSSPGYFTYKNE